MAVRLYTDVTPAGMRGAKIFKWTGLLNTDTGTPLDASVYSDRSFQAIGTFGAGGTVTMEGSNLPAGGTMSSLHQVDGTTALTLATGAASLKTNAEATMWIHPNVTAGDGTTSLDVYAFINTVK